MFKARNAAAIFGSKCFNFLTDLTVISVADCSAENYNAMSNKVYLELSINSDDVYTF